MSNIASGLVAALCILGISAAAFAQPSPVHFATGTWPWYTSDALSVTPEPPIAGEVVELCTDLVNPTATGYNVIVRFYCADFAIGASFTPIGGDRYVYLPPYSNVRECIHWVAPASGPWSFQARLMTSGYDDEVIERNIDMYETLEPLTPDTLEFIVRNASPSTATITLGLIPQLSDWGLELSQDVIPNLPSGGEQTILLITTPASVLPINGSPVTDIVAYIGGDMLSGFRKIYNAIYPCYGARFDLTPAISSINSTTDYEERGAFITAIRGLEVCAIGMEIDLQTPQEVTARIYEADGTTRGLLLGQWTGRAERTGKTFHYVPLIYELLPCRDYDISFEYGPANSFDWIPELSSFEPFDVGGFIRVRDGEYAGDASNYALPKLSIIGHPLGDFPLTDLTPEGIEWNSCGDATTDRGVFVTPHQTITLTAVGWEADFSAVPIEINAFVYDGTGRSRGSMIAMGRAAVVSSGLMVHRIPISAVLEEGEEYDIAVTFPATSWSCIGEGEITIPFTAGGILSVNDGELGGNAANSILPHFQVEWAPGAGGNSFSLAKISEGYPPPLISTSSNTNYGLFISALIRQEMYSLGWEADVQPGEPLYAWVFEASGTSRGSLISTGSMFAVEGETRWHDIPVAATLEPGADYNIEIGFGQMNQWAFWEDYTGMPYTRFGLFEVYAASQGGSTNGHRIIHMRVNGCNASATGVNPGASHAPRFTLDAPYPNPVSQSASLGYSMDEAGTVTIAVYDVTGRRVALLIDDAYLPVGSGRVDFDARNLAAGVYFVKMETAAKSVSRKITIVR